MFSLRWTRSRRFVVFGPTETFRCYRRIQLGATDLTTGKTTYHLLLWYLWSSSTQWILSSTSITFLSVLCVVTQGPNPFTTNSRRPFLEIDVKGGERDHIKAYHFQRERKYHFHRGRENTQVECISQGSQMLGVQEERCHMSSWGERHVHMCLFALVCISSVHLYLSALIFCSLSSPSIPC